MAAGSRAVVVPEGISLGIAVVAVTAFGAVRQEFHHPFSGNLFGTVLISLLQLPIVLARRALSLARLMWMLGAGGMIFVACPPRYRQVGTTLMRLSVHLFAVYNGLPTLTNQLAGYFPHGWSSHQNATIEFSEEEIDKYKK